MQGYALKRGLGRCAAGLVKLGRIEIGEANLDPLVGVGRPADAQAVPVANVLYRAGESDTGLGWQRRFTRVCIGGRDRAEDKHAGKKVRLAAHAAAFNVLLPFFFFRSARTNLSQRTMPARFSGM